MLLNPGGFRKWYRAMEGSDEDLSTAKLMLYAGRFSKRVQSFCKRENIPFVYFPVGERKYTEAELLKPKDKSFTGIFAVFVSRAPSLLWEIKKFENGSIDIRRKKKTSLVNHYYFHIMDKEWGHIIIRMCAHPPFSCNIILNGHEWVERQQDYSNLQATKEGNCFTSYNNGEKLSQIADTLKFKGQFEQVCQRWVYSCLWFVMDEKQQQDTGFCYKYSVYQIEYSRNLLFSRGRLMDHVFQKIIDNTRGCLNIKKLKTIFGKKNRPYKIKSTAPAPEVRVETPDYNLTIFKIHFGRLTVKLYDKGERTLRAEVVVHNTKDLKCNRGIDSFAQIVEKLETIMGSFLSNLEYAHIATIDDETFEQMSTPTQTGSNRLAGIDFSKKQTKLIAMGLMSLSVKPGGFTSKDLSQVLEPLFNGHFSSRHASYHIKKFRGKGLVSKVRGSIKYCMNDYGIKTIAAILGMLNNNLPMVNSVVNTTYKDQYKDQLLEIDKLMLDIHTICQNYKKLILAA